MPKTEKPWNAEDSSVQQELDQESAQKAISGRSDYELRYSKARGYYREPTPKMQTAPRRANPPMNYFHEDDH